MTVARDRKLMTSDNSGMVVKVKMVTEMKGSYHQRFRLIAHISVKAFVEVLNISRGSYFNGAHGRLVIPLYHEHESTPENTIDLFE